MTMRVLPALTLLAAITSSAPPRELPVVQPNPNTERAGVLQGGVLSISLEAKASAWHMDGDGRPSRSIEAFSETGKAPVIPAPLVRAAKGTEIRFSVRNSLALPLTFALPAGMRGVAGPFAQDSVVIPPGTVGTLTTRALVPGNYLYRATTPSVASEQLLIAGLLAGAIVIDSVEDHARPRDRVFVIMMNPDSAAEANAATSNIITGTGRLVFTINGRSWPRTERISATVGDSVHWRIINASADVHPMHLHGFYYRVDTLTGPLVAVEGQGAPGRMVVTERMSPFSAMSMTWSPERPGNWIFHCHFAAHLTPDSISAQSTDHGMMGMVGLILGINVADRPGVRVAGAAAPSRRLRLVAVTDSGFPDSEPSMRFVLEGSVPRGRAPVGHSLPIELTRGQPVAITVVNHLAEPTAVHWHGIELESYNDGVAGVSGSGGRLARMIAPGDSFEARFTPPRAGTFIYHAHMDEVRQQQAGLAGALIVRERGEAPSADEHVFFIKGARRPSAPSPLEINGMANPDTIVLHVGRPARLRFISLAMFNPNATVVFTARPDSAETLVNDGGTVRWRPMAKDGADLPAGARVVRPARQIIGMGETYDFEYTPDRPGNLRLEVRSSVVNPGGGQLFVRVPVRVE